MAKKAKAARLPAPKTAEEAAEYARTMGELLGRMQDEKAEAERAIAAIKEKAEERIAGLQKQAYAHARGILTYADKNRPELTEEERRKTVKLLEAGSIEWYWTPTRVVIADDGEAVGYCQDHDLDEFVRITSEPNKSAMLDDQERAARIPGVHFMRDEKFAIRPSHCDFRIETNLSAKQLRFSIVSNTSKETEAAAQGR